MIWAANLSDPPKDGGFTLIELLVVLSILALVLALAPQFARGVPGARFREAVMRVVGTMRSLHDRAEQTGHATGISFNTGNLTWRLLPSGEVGKLPTAIDRLSVTTSLTGNGRDLLVRFFPDGTATGTQFEIWSGSRRATIRIGWITGQVHADE